jgi:hypothetical protein
MYEMIPYIMVTPNFQVQQIAAPESNSIQPLYNTTPMINVPLMILPPGGIYKIEFNNSTLIQLNLTRFNAQVGSFAFSQISENYFWQSIISPQTRPTYLGGTLAVTILNEAQETLYLKTNGFTIDTTGLPNGLFVEVYMPTYLQLQLGLQAYNKSIGQNVELIYPSKTFYTNASIINPLNWNVVSPFGIEYPVSVISPNGEMYTVGFDIPDIYGNDIAFTINGQSIFNSPFSNLPRVMMDIVPIHNYEYFNIMNPMPMSIGGIYNYGTFDTLGYADGIPGDNPVFLKETFNHFLVQNSYVIDDDMIWVLSLRGSKYGIKPYGLMLGSLYTSGYQQPLMLNVLLPIANTPNVSNVLQSRAYYLPEMLSHSTSSITMSSYNTQSTQSTSQSNNISQSSNSTKPDLTVWAIISAILGGLLLTIM